MKTIYRISLFFNIICICFILVKSTEYYFKNFATMPEVKENYRNINNQINSEKINDTLQNNNVKKDITVSSLPVLKTSCDTTFIVKEHDYRTGETTSHEEKMPEMYIGKTREQLEDIMIDYSISPELSDVEKGFQEMSLDSFSDQLVICTKYYTSNPSDESFYLLVEDDFISVYCSDLKTVYLYTGIQMNHLPENIQQEILDRKYIANKEELYNFLESYSS